MMRTTYSFFCLAVLAQVLSSCVSRVEAPSNPGTASTAQVSVSEHGRLVLGPNLLESLTVMGSRAGKVVRRDFPADSAEGRILQLDAGERTEQGWDVQCVAYPVENVSEGDVLFIDLEARCLDSADESGGGTLGIVWERKAGRKFININVFLGPEWKRIQIPFVQAQSLAAEDGKFGLWIGGNAPAKFQVRGVRLVNHGKSLSVQDLPATRTTYHGREPNAPWRAAAAARIDRYRKADMVVRVVDAQGNPISGAGIKVRQTKQAYGFGTCVNEQVFLAGDRNSSSFEPVNEDQKRDRDQYRSVLRDYFNASVSEGLMKWGAWKWETGRRKTDEYLHWAAANSIDHRGHCLVWPSWKKTPTDLYEHRADRQYLENAVTERITATLEYYTGRVREWDVVNEILTERDLLDVMGDDVVVDWFKQARATDPQVKLYLNDFMILSMVSTKKDQLLQKLRHYLAKGAPIDGVGLQSHFGPTMPSVDYVWNTLEEFARLGVELKATEVDFALDHNKDEQLQADSLRDFMTIFYSHPATSGIILWGFWENSHWRASQGCALWRVDWTMKPNARVWEQLVMRDWRTNVEGVTGPDGVYSARAFLGEFAVQVQVGEKVVTRELSLGEDGAELRVRMD